LSTSLSLPLSLDMVYTSSDHVSNMDDSLSIFGAFLVEPSLKFVLQWSVVVKLDNCLLRVNLASYNFKFFCTPSTFPRFLLARNVNYQNQTLIFDNDISKCLSKICKSSSKSRSPCCQKPSKIFFALWTQLEVAVARPEHQTTSIFFIFGLLPIW
jgi:hypothetical protein